MKTGLRKNWYLLLTKASKKTIRSPLTPDQLKRRTKANVVIGPFRTKRELLIVCRNETGHGILPSVSEAVSTAAREKKKERRSSRYYHYKWPKDIYNWTMPEPYYGV